MDPLCLEATVFADSKLIRFGLAAKGLLCLLSAITSPLFLVKKTMKWMPSPSTKVLFLAHMFWAIEVPAGFVLVYVFDFARFSVQSTDPCYYVLPSRIGVTLRAIPGIGATFQTISMFTFSIERLVATIFPIFFEKSKNNYLGLFLTVTSTVINGGSWIYLVLVKADWSDKQILSTVTTKTNADPIDWLRRFYLSLEIFTLLLFSITLLYNKFCSNARHSENLSKKYQLSENRKVMDALLPCFGTHFFLNLLQFGGFVLFPVFVPDRNRFDTAVWVELVFFQSYLYGLFMPLIIMVKLRRQRTSVVNVHLSIDDHFDQINQFYEEKFVMARRNRRTYSAAIG